MSDSTNAITLTSFFERFRMSDVAAMQLVPASRC